MHRIDQPILNRKSILHKITYLHPLLYLNNLLVQSSMYFTALFQRGAMSFYFCKLN